jgi:hypothetical protein
MTAITIRGLQWWMIGLLTLGSNFAGTFVGMACQDLAGTLRASDFEGNAGNHVQLDVQNSWRTGSTSKV